MHGISRTTGVLASLELRLWAADGPDLPNHALCGVALGKAGNVDNVDVHCWRAEFEILQEMLSVCERLLIVGSLLNKLGRCYLGEWDEKKVNKHVFDLYLCALVSSLSDILIKKQLSCSVPLPKFNAWTHEFPARCRNAHLSSWSRNLNATLMQNPFFSWPHC